MFRKDRQTYFFNHFLSGKNIILCILKGILPFKMHKIILVSRIPENIIGFTSKLR